MTILVSLLTALFLAIMLLGAFFIGYVIGSKYRTLNIETGADIEADLTQGFTVLREKFSPPTVVIRSPYKRAQVQKLEKDLESI